MTSGGNSKRRPEFEAAIMLFGVTFLCAFQDLAPVAVFTFVLGVIATVGAFKESRSE